MNILHTSFLYWMIIGGAHSTGLQEVGHFYCPHKYFSSNLGLKSPGHNKILLNIAQVIYVVFWPEKCCFHQLQQ
ncbi:hypothetical protein BDD12DRAFT_456632 [Trichophaea hybrida]|nr:hypothetical protein BDD12DRAFT_456632 [Trichophaea hybrida]